MVFETASRTSRSQIPQTKSLVPRAGKGVVSVRRENDIADEVRVSVQTFLGNAVVEFVTSKIPNDQSLVYEKILEQTLASERYRRNGK